MLDDTGKIRLRKRPHIEFLRLARQTRKKIVRELRDVTGGVVQDGPVKGLQLATTATWGSDFATQIFGLYEQQLAPHLTGSPGAVFLDIGAADGFWAVGLVQAGHVDHAIAFEMRPEGQEAILALALDNGVSDKVSIHGEATVETISRVTEALPADRPLLVLVDVEGAEFDLVTSGFLTTLSNATVIIELHPWESDEPTAVEDLINMASATHTVTRLNDATRDCSALIDRVEGHDLFRYLLISEDRSRPQEWLILHPKTAI